MESGYCLQTRRKFLGLTIEELAKITSIHESMLLRFEEKLPKSEQLLTSLEHALLLPHGSMRDSAVAAAPVPTAAADIKAILERLTSRIPRTGPARPVDDKAKLQMLLQRYGLMGKSKTYLEIAETWGTSRYHVQQLVKAKQVAARALCVRSVAISTIRAALNTRLPAVITDIEGELRGLLGEGLSLEDANRFSSDFLDGPLYLETDGVGYSPADLSGPAIAAAIAEADALAIRTACDVVLTAIRHVGVCNIDAVTQTVNDELNAAVTAEKLANALSVRYPNFEWIAQKWFWLGPERGSTLEEWLVKMFLAAERPLSLLEIKMGIMSGKVRQYGRYNIGTYLLSDEVLTCLLIKIPGITQKSKALFEFDHTLYAGSLDVFTWAEKILVAYFRLAGGSAYRSELLRDLVQSELLPEDFLGNTLSSSPLFQSQGEASWMCVCANPMRAALSDTAAEISVPRN